MAAADRKLRERSDRQARIVAAARKIAESEGWSAVTIRRLADQIEYSQPVLYSHFESRDAIVAAVAIAGFTDLTAELKGAAQRSPERPAALQNVAASYLDFARKQPAVYAAMFAMPTNPRFAEAETRSELKDAFATLAAVVAPTRTDVGVATETFWAALHGLSELERAGRIRQRYRQQRIALVVRSVLDS